MTIGKFGNRIAIGSQGSRLVVANPAQPTARPPLPIGRYVRNNKHPSALAESMKRELANQCALYRTKEYFGGLMQIPGTALESIDIPVNASEVRRRFAFHSGPYAHAACAIVAMDSPNSTTAAGYAELDFATSNTESPTVLSTLFNYGGQTAAVYGWSTVKLFMQIIDGLTPDTDYYGVLWAKNWGRIYGFTVFELASLTENFNGYLSQNIAVQTPILDVYRENLAVMTRALARRGAGKVFHWNVNPQSLGSNTDATDNYQTITTLSTIEHNILDNASGSVSTNTPGWTPVMNNHDRSAAGGVVRLIMKAYGKIDAAGTGGVVKIKDSTGATVATISNVWTNAFSWQSVAFTISATTAKYDIHYATLNAAVRFSLGAISIYEQEV